MKSHKIDQYFEFAFQTCDKDSQAPTDADALPTYRVYEEDNETAVATGNCAKRDDSNTVGYYVARGQITTAAGYEAGKAYAVRVAATVATNSGAQVVGEFVVVPDIAWNAEFAGGFAQVDLMAICGDPDPPSVLGAAFAPEGAGEIALAKLTISANSPGSVLVIENTNEAAGTVTIGAHANVPAVMAGPVALESLSCTDWASLTTAVWGAATRTLTGFGTLVADTATAVWSAATRALTDKSGFAPAASDNATATASTLASAHGSGSWETADVSGVALESTLTAIKGAGWTDETLKDIKDTIDTYDAETNTMRDRFATMVEVNSEATYQFTHNAVSAAGGYTYWAKVDFTKDQTNARDEYTVIWHRNGEPITSGITSPTITITRRADGTALVAETALVEIGSTGVFKHTETTNRMTDGEAAVLTLAATIDDAPRTCVELIAKDAI